MSLRKLVVIRHSLGHRIESCDFPALQVIIVNGKNKFSRLSQHTTTCFIFADSDPFCTSKRACILPSVLFFSLFFYFRVAHKLLTTHTVLGAVHTAQSVYHSQVMLKINLQYRYSKLWQIVMCWHSHKLLVKKSNTSLFCHFMFETRDGHIMQSLRVCKLHKCLGFTKQAWLWKFFLLQLGMCLLPKRL